jgi:hypothetical protein
MDAINPHLQPALTIPQLCLIMGISVPTYRKAQRKGYGPKETRIENTVRILYVDFLAWKGELQNPESSIAQAVKQIAAKQHARGKLAGAAAARSAKHVSNTRRKLKAKRNTNDGIAR